MSAAGQLDHWWVSEQWLRDVGLTQYASRFREHLIDGRTLASLTRKDFERHLGMDGKKPHQDSALRGVQLLQMLAFNSQVSRLIDFGGRTYASIIGIFGFVKDDHHIS